MNLLDQKELRKTSGAETAPAQRRRRTSRGTVVTVAAWVVTALIVFPLAWVLLLSFREGGSFLQDPLALKDFTLENYAKAFANVPLVRMYANTLLIAVSAVVVCLVLSFMVAMAVTILVFRNPKLQNIVRGVFLAGLAIPVYILLFPVYRIDLALGLYGSYLALILPYIAVQIPFNVLLVSGFLNDLPKELYEAAVIDGCNFRQLATRIVAPLMAPIFATCGILHFLYVFNEFPFASILIADDSMATISLVASQFRGEYTVDYGAIMAATCLILIPQILIYIVLQKRVIAGMTVGAVKS
ncbi:carbohydrate ABC transporter permease [Microbacterium murale]|uniref:ABC transporter permease n=1 Tax=Microbacterium murale TaxID=1081040 RepID=A0ABQ1S3E3_9MICO|nr:carbohydrate ABC transporter permease [Microbacterium murale]GGD89095.1 ABC transporter permease [Microbacterium murale]